MERLNLKKLMRLRAKNSNGLKSQTGAQFWKTPIMMWMLIQLRKLLERISKFQLSRLIPTEGA
jgi:hypothetical protein